MAPVGSGALCLGGVVLAPGAPVSVTARDEGRVLGRYRLVRRLARGGMATVYQAELLGEHGFAKTVAIKTIHPNMANDARFLEMFLAEARIASRIAHPNVCAITDFGMDEGSPYLVMEYLDGFSLASILARRRGPIPPDVAARIVADAARGLDAAHAMHDENGRLLGVVHRDVSPQNLFLLRSGVAKVLDFGIAKATHLGGNTAVGTLKGKMSYMAPEQLHGLSVDRRVDVWALGVVLWEATVGKRLFGGTDPGDIAAGVLGGTIARPASIVAGYPEALSDVVMAALSRNPAKRTATSAALADALERYLYSLGRPCGPSQVSAWLASSGSEESMHDDVRTEPSGATTSTTRTVPGVPPRAALERITASMEEPAPPVAEVETAILTPSEEARRPVTPAPSEAPPGATVEASDTPHGPGPVVPGRRRRRLVGLALAASGLVAAIYVVGTMHGPSAAPPRETAQGSRVAAVNGTPPVSASPRAAPIHRATHVAAARSLVPAAARPAAPAAAGSSAPTPAEQPDRAAPRPRASRDHVKRAGTSLPSPAPSVPSQHAVRRPVPTPAVVAHARPPIAPHGGAPSTGSAPAGARADDSPAPPPQRAPPRSTGWLSVMAVPRARVWLGSTDLGWTPLRREVPAGTHRLRARSEDGARERTLTVEIPAHGHVHINPFSG